MSDNKEIEALKFALNRERSSRKMAESILESKSLELHQANEKLKALNQQLSNTNSEQQVEIQEFAHIIMNEFSPIFKTNYNSDILLSNKAAIEVFGEIKSIQDMPCGEKIFEHAIKSINSQKEESCEITINKELYSFTFFPTKKEVIIYAKNDTAKLLVQNALKLSEEKYRGIIENLEMGILEVDLNENITVAHQGFCDLLGWEENELIGKNALKLFVEEEEQARFKKETSVRTKGQRSVYEIQMKKKSGENIWVLISGAPLYNETGKIIGSIGIHWDITEQKRKEVLLEEANRKAELSLKSKELFLANMSHEIRTPMNAIIGLSNLLNDTPLNLTQTKYLRAIKGSGENLLVIINDILDLSKIEAGKIELENIPFDLEKKLLESFDLMKYKAEEKGLSYRIRFEKDLHKIVSSDPTRLNQIVTNIISNAVKFTDQGEVSMEVKRISDSSNNQTIQIQIKDTGIGIQANKMDKIFENFTQENDSTTRTYGGTGLGLPITKKLTDLLGGSLEVQSEVGKGTTFTIHLPFEKVDKETILEENITYSFENLDRSIKILAAEDNKINQLVLENTLKQYGLKVTIVDNGLKAIKALQKETYDILLLDIQMPVMNGMEACSVIRNDLKSNIPIVALTANAMKGEKEKCLKLGMNHYISKPFSPATLISIIESSKSKLTHKKQSSQNKKQSSKKAKNSPLINMDKIRNVFQGDKEFELKMIHLFIETIEEEVVLLKEALQNKNISEIAIIAHKIKPTIIHMCEDPLPSLVKKFEIPENINLPKDHKEIMLFINMLETAKNELSKRS